MPAVATPVPTLVRIEYLSPSGWVQMGADASVLFPARLVERYREKNKFVRVTELDDRLQPGQVWVADDLPDPASLVKDLTGGPCIWKLPDPALLCAFCEEEHRPPHDGRCIL